MPLFGSKHKHDKEHAPAPGAGGTRHAMGPSSAFNDQDHRNTQVLHHNGVPTATAGSGAGLGIGTQPGLVTGQPRGMADSVPYHDERQDYGHASAREQTSSIPGVPSSTGATRGSGTHDYNNTNHSSGPGTRMTGKVESALGNAFNSESLKAKGLEKQREADLLNGQVAELGEAERLDREADMHRQRAEGLAAHGRQPDNMMQAGHGGRQPW